MKTSLRPWALLAFLLSALFTCASALGDDHKGDNKAGMAAAEPVLAEMWMVWPKAGESRAFEAKLKEFVAWRKKAGDPMTWTVWSAALGDDLDAYGIRSQAVDWADLDAARDWGRQAKAGDKYQEMMAPLVHKVSRYIDEFDPELSHWKHEGDARYVGVSRVKVLPGKWGEVKASLQTFKKAADEQKWSESWAVMYNMGGSGGMLFVWPYDSYADMADPEVTGAALLEKALGSKEKAEEVMKSYGSGVERVDYTIWAHRPELSTPKD